jgi:urease accessory protein
MVDSSRSSRSTFAVAIAASMLLSPVVVLAHPETGAVGGFVSGVLHPLTGVDHVAAMFAVGLWGAFLGAPAMFALPIVFPVVMAFGGALGIAGVPMPGIETGIACSGIVLGSMVATGARPPIWIAAVIVGVFAIFHGYAHGVEMPHVANPLTYAIGFVLATGTLHLAGIAFGLLTRWNSGRIIVRLGGGAISAIGLGFLLRLI